ncbi:hypothetical protein HNR21_001417 [Actinomadura cellulosilytica]|uniref:Uncharacterized protein n=1 Tax=Thermomonospora cellulosilytica TaxID=1411118 RepID=A0A7W3R7N2_9ACTN|nr:hypothetical protein [Thermomonospora cellulosilytica]
MSMRIRRIFVSLEGSCTCKCRRKFMKEIMEQIDVMCNHSVHS